MRVDNKLNSNGRFAVFYVAVISVAVVVSLYADHLDSWNRVVFTFPPETQKVVNGTATMEIQWRWLPETLEMIVKVNDDESNIYINNSYFLDVVCIIFDSDNNGNLTCGWGYNWRNFDDRGIYLFSKVFPWTNRTSLVVKNCWIDSKKHVFPPMVWSSFYTAIATLDNTTTCTFKEGEGYTFHTSIPIKYINVKPPTQVIINYVDEDYRFPRLTAWGPEVDEAFLVAQLWM